MSLTTAELEELQSIVLTLSEEFPHNQDLLWDAAIRIQVGGLGPTSGAGGQPAFDAAVADIKLCQDEVQDYQGRSGSPESGFDVAVLQVIPPTSTFPLGNVGDIIFLDTAPNTYLATDQIQITPLGPNSVQMDEVGTTVARTVPAASGGLEVNNLSTGGGFERALTTSDSLAHNAEFVTMSLSANLPSERVLVGGNGITLVDGGAGGNATLNLDDPLSVANGLFTNPAVIDLVDADVAIVAGGVGAAQHIEIDLTSIQSKTNLTTAGILNLNQLGGVLNVGPQSGTGQVSIFGDGVSKMNFLSNRVQLSTPTSPGVGLAQDLRLRWQQQDGQPLMDVGFDGATEAIIEVQNDGGDLRITCTNNALARVEMLRCDPDAISLTGPRLILNNTNDPDLVDTNVGLNVGAVDPDASQHIEIGNSDIQSKSSNIAAAQINLNAVGGNVFVGAQTGAGNVRLFNNGEDVLQTIAQGIQVLGAEVNDPSTGGTQRTFINLQNNIGALTTFLGHGIAATTECILRNAVRSGLMTIEGVDSGNANTPLFRGDPNGQAEMFNDGTSVARTLAAAAGGLEANNTSTGAGFERVLTTGDLGGGVTSFEGRVGAVVATVGDYADVLETFSVLQTFGAAQAVAIANNLPLLSIQDSDAALNEGNWLVRVTAGDLVISTALDATPFVQGPQAISMIRGTGNTFSNFQMGGPILMAEVAAAVADVALFGQIWVNSVPNPNELYFTDDSGNDIDLVTDLWNNGTLQAQSTALGLDVRDTLKVGSLGSTTGVLKLGEQASADADEAGYGQLWMETDTPNRFKFTDDSGQDFDVGMVGGFVSDNVFLNSSRDFNTAGNFAANNILYYADGSNNTITVEASASVVQWPVFTSIQVVAPGSGVQTVAEGTGTTIFDDTGTDLVGGFTLSQGVITIFRASTTDYIAFGSGITP